MATGTSSRRPAQTGKRAGRRSFSAQAGFTLLEIMMVLVIIGIVASFAMLSIGSDPIRDQVENEGKRLASLIQLHRETALLRIEERGMAFTEDGYQVLQWMDGEWIPPVDSSLIPEVQLPEGLKVELFVEDLPAELVPDPKREVKSENDTEPQVWFSSSGEVIPFEIIVGDVDGRHRFTVSVAVDGRMTTSFESRAG